MNSIIRVILDSFGNDDKHFVNSLEDNFISKELMSVAYNAAYASTEESDESNVNK